MRRAARRISRWPHKRMRNRKAEIGSRRPKMAPGKSGKCARSRAPAIVTGCANSFRVSLLSRKQGKQLGFELRELQRRRAAARMYHHIPSQGNLLTMQSQYLAHAPSDSVPHHGVAQRLLDAHSKAVFRQAVAPREYHERGTRTPPPFTIDGVVLRAPHQPPFTRQISLRRRPSEGSFFVHAESLKRALARAALWRDAAPALCGHSWFSFARGNHASCGGGEHAVERCASATNLLLKRAQRL